MAGHFFWLLTSHDNPGRVQGGEGLRELDRIGPVNYKGMLTPWEESTDLFYMFRSNYVSAQKEPMVYIASHTWSNRWMKPGLKDSIMVYSNCDEVALFNDLGKVSLGKQKRGGFGTHFTFNKANIQHNILYAIGFLNGKPVARDTVFLDHLPEAPGIAILKPSGTALLKPRPGLNYVYRVNSGGADYVDEWGSKWSADRALPANVGNKYWGSSSWTSAFDNMPAFFLRASEERMPLSKEQKIGSYFNHSGMDSISSTTSFLFLMVITRLNYILLNPGWEWADLWKQQACVCLMLPLMVRL